MARKRTRKPRAQMGADLYWQVSESEIEKAELLAGLLGGLQWPQVLGHHVAIKRKLVKLGAVDGRVPVPDPEVDAWLAAAAVWPVSDAQRLATALRRAGLVQAMAGPSGGHVVAGMEPYQEMKKRHDALSEAGARGAQTRKDKGGYGQAITTPKPGYDQDVAPESPDHGKQEQEHDQQQQHDHDSALAAGASAATEAAPEPTPVSMTRRRKAKAEPTVDDPSKPSPFTLLREAYAATWAKAGRTEPLLLPVKPNGEINHGGEGTLWNKILGAARQVAPPAATDGDVVAVVLERLVHAASLQKRQQNTEGQWVGVPKINSLEDFARHFGECIAPKAIPGASQPTKRAGGPTNPERMIAPREDGEIREILPT